MCHQWPCAQTNGVKKCRFCYSTMEWVPCTWVESLEAGAFSGATKVQASAPSAIPVSWQASLVVSTMRIPLHPGSISTIEELRRPCKLMGINACTSDKWCLGSQCVPYLIFTPWTRLSLLTFKLFHYNKDILL